MLSGRYFIPGPVEIDPEVFAAMQRPMIGHRGDVARELVARCQPTLRALFGTTRPVMMVTGSATAIIESAVRAAVRERMLSVVSGTFGERIAYIGEQCGKEVVRVHVPRGRVLEPEMLERFLDGPPFDTVSMVHSETSTGALAPVEALLRRIRQLPDVVTIVDGVSTVGGLAVEADAWGTDFYLTGSQKAIGIPPGLAFGVASERLLERARTAADRGFYLDLNDVHQAAVESRFPQTPALPVVYALDVQLARIAREGLPSRFARHRAMRERMEQWVASHGRCGIQAPTGRRSETVTGLTLAPGKSAKAIVRDLAAQGWTLTTGLEEDEDRVVRVGHMGDLQVSQLEPLLEALVSVL